MKDHDHALALAAAVRAAYDADAPLEIVAGGTRRAFGRSPAGAPLSVAAHTGIVELHDPGMRCHRKRGPGRRPPKGPPRPAGHDLKGGVGVVGGAHRGGERQGVVMVFHKPLAPPVAPGMTRTPS